MTFDIIIPTYNRYDGLPTFFEKNIALANHPRTTLWLIDDGSVKSIADIIPSWSNLVTILRHENKGQAYVRNVAIARGHAPYIISLDDDAWFLDGPGALETIERAFVELKGTGCLMFNIATPHSDYASSTPDRSVIPLHVTCGCAYRRETLGAIGGFNGFMHSQAEESDISLRIYREGWDIRFLSGVKVFHNFLPGERPLSWTYYNRYNTTRNDLLIVLMYYPLWMVPFFVLGKFLSHLKYAMLKSPSPVKSVLYTLKAFLGFISLSGVAVKKRDPLSTKQLTLWRKLARHYAN